MRIFYRFDVVQAEATADELQLADGRPLRLDEDSQLAVPFLLPDDGYSCDVMRSIPTGLLDVIGPLQQVNPLPTIHFHQLHSH